MKQAHKISTIFKEFSKKYPRYFIYLLLLLVIESIFAAGSILAIIPLADFMLDPSLTSPGKITTIAIQIFSSINIDVGFWTFGLFFVAFNLFNNIFKVLVRFSILRIKYAILNGLFSETLGTFFRAKWNFFSEDSHGELLNTLNRELLLIGDTVGHIATQFSLMFQLVIYLSIPLWLNMPMTIMTVTLAAGFGLPFLILNKLSYRLGKGNTRTYNIAIGILNETIQSARIILGFGRQKHARKRYLDAFSDHMNVSIKSQTLKAAVPLLFSPFGMLAVIVALGMSIENGANLAELAAVMWSLLTAMPIISTLLQANVSINNFLPSYDQLVELRSKAEKYREVDGDIEYKNLNSGIRLNNVNFSYPSCRNTINNLNMYIPKGGVIALVGESGSGKSTVTDLILGLQEPSSGEILINDVSLLKYKKNSFRQRIGYVPQDPILFHSTIRENLLWSCPGSSDKELWKALRMANAELFVKGFPEGINTVVGERGVRMSGGQRQRVALARALLRKPDFLILDEATSALDTESEKMIQESIDNLSHNISILIVAHRLSTIKNASLVYVMKSGSVIESGSYIQLSSKEDSILSGMISKQNKGL